jgi:ribonuclease E
MAEQAAGTDQETAEEDKPADPPRRGWWQRTFGDE